MGIGILESICPGGGRHGYLRAIPTDEKVFWHSSAVSSRNNGAIVKSLLEGVGEVRVAKKRWASCSRGLAPLARGTEEITEVVLRSPEEEDHLCSSGRWHHQGTLMFPNLPRLCLPSPWVHTIDSNCGT